MPSVYDLKPAFQRLLRPIVGRLASLGATPNAITLLALALSGACGAALALFPESRWAWAALPAVLLARMALNAIDGMLAREFGMQTRLGAYLNEIGDILSDAALYFPLALSRLFSPIAAVLFVFLGALSETIGILSQALGGGRRYEGPMGKSDRAVLVGALGLLAAAGAISPVWGTWALSIACAALSWTCLRRAALGLREAS